MIRSDDPQAIEKLQAELERLQGKLAHYRAINAALNASSGAHKRLVQAGLTAAEARGRVQAGKYPRTRLRTLETRVGQVRRRIEEIQEVRNCEPLDREFAPGMHYYEDPKAHRLGFRFDGRIRKRWYRYLYQQGFRWSPRNDRWQRYFSPEGREVSRRVREYLKRYEGEILNDD